jgi:hypothetical protein
MALPILLIARLLAYHDQVGITGTFTEHRLRRVPVEVAPPTTRGGSPQRRQGRARRDEIRRGAGGNDRTARHR